MGTLNRTVQELTVNRCECIIPCGCGTVAGQRSGWGGMVSLNAEPAQVSANPVYEKLDQAISTYTNRSLPNLAKLSGCSRCQCGNDVEVFEFESESDDLLAQSREVVLVGSANLFDETGDLPRVFALHAPAQVFVLKAADVELAAAQGLE